MDIGRRGFMAAAASLFGALLVPINWAKAACQRRQVFFVDARRNQKVPPGQLVCVRPPKGTDFFSIMVSGDDSTRIRFRDTQGPKGAGLVLGLLGSIQCHGKSLIFLEHESGHPGTVTLVFEGRRTE